MVVRAEKIDSPTVALRVREIVAVRQLILKSLTAAMKEKRNAARTSIETIILTSSRSSQPLMWLRKWLAVAVATISSKSQLETSLEARASGNQLRTRVN